MDSAHNLDALTNLFLGIRLYHYQKSLKGLALVLGINKNVDVEEALKLLRYLLKKVNGNLVFVPMADGIDYQGLQELVTKAKDLNIKARVCSNFAEGLTVAKTLVDERDGLICVTGSNELIKAYWENRGIKKF